MCGSATLFYAVISISFDSFCHNNSIAFITNIKECGAATQVVGGLFVCRAEARSYHEGCGSATLSVFPSTCET